MVVQSLQTPPKNVWMLFPRQSTQLDQLNHSWRFSAVIWQVHGDHLPSRKATSHRCITIGGGPVKPPSNSRGPAAMFGEGHASHTVVHLPKASAAVRKTEVRALSQRRRRRPPPPAPAVGEPAQHLRHRGPRRHRLHPRALEHRHRLVPGAPGPRGRCDPQPGGKAPSLK